jgi:hypothetical protein
MTDDRRGIFFTNIETNHFITHKDLIMKIFFKLLLLLALVALTGQVYSQGSIAITKYPAYIPAPSVDQDSTTAAPFAIYVTFTGGSASSEYYVKVGTPAYTDATYLAFTYVNQAGVWGRNTGYNNANFTFKTDASGNWQGWIPVKAQKSGITQLAVRARLASGSNVNSAIVNLSGMTTAGSSAGYLVGNLLDGNNGTKDNKVVVAYNGTTIRGIWFSESDSSAHFTTPYAINEIHTNYTTAASLVNASGGYAMLVPSGANAITKIEVYSYPSTYGTTQTATGLLSYLSGNVTIPDSIPAAGRLTSVGKASDLTIDAKVPSGAGTASLANSLAGTLNGSAIFPRNASSQTVMVTVTGVTAGNLDSVRVTVPTDFTSFSSGNITLGGAFSGKTMNVSGNQIVIRNAALGTTAGTVTITGLTTPNPVSAQANGNSKWTVETAGADAVFTEIGTSPVSYTIIPIANVRTGATDGFGNISATGDTIAMRNQTVAVTGVVTVPSAILQAGTNTSGVIQDGNYGLELFRYGAPTTAFNRGDSVIVKGMLTPYTGGAEIAPLSTTSPDFYVVGAGTLPTPRTFSNASVVAESLECALVKITSASYDSAGKTFYITANSVAYNNFHTSPTDLGTLFISSVSPLSGKSIPVSGDIEGVVLHRNNYTGNQTIYKVAPRDAYDLGLDPADGSGLAAIKPSTQMPSTAVAETLTVTGDGSNTIAGLSVTIPSTWTWSDTSSKVLSGTGFASAVYTVTGTGATATPYVLTISGCAVTDAATGTIILTNLTTPNATGSTTFTVKTRGTVGTLTAISSSPTVNITGGFEAVASGNWSSTSVWSGGVVPTSTSDVTMTTKNVVVTITDGAQCRNLTIMSVDSAGSAVGPILQFPVSGATTFTVNGRFDMSTATGKYARPQFTSNGNSSATVVFKGYVYTNVSNSSTYNYRGLNLSEGTVKFLGATTDTLKTGAGFRLGNLIIGDGVNAKILHWSQTSSATMVITGLTVKIGSSFILGSDAYDIVNGIGNYNTVGLPTLSSGVTIETGASLTVANTASTIVSSYINIADGGLTNDGTLNLISPNGSRKYYLAFGDLYTSVDPDGSKQTVSGSAIGTFSFVKNGLLDTVILNQKMNVVDSLFYIKGLLQETPGNIVVGIAKSVNTVGASTTSVLGGIGVAVTTTDSALGATTVLRYTGVTAVQSGNGNQSIYRYYDITPTINTNLHATVDFFYNTADLNGQDAATLMLWKSTDNGSTWSIQPATVNTGSYLLHTTNVNSFSRWTMADAVHPLGATSQFYSLKAGWNMVSIPLTLVDYTKSVLYPTAISDAFYYDGSYQSASTLQNNVGYWLKFVGDESVGLSGIGRLSDSVNVVVGWNMIGTLSSNVLVSAIVQSTPGMVTSSYFGYNASYQSVDTLVPGQAYWVKSSSVGKLYLNASTVLAKQPASTVNATEEMSSLTVTDKNGNKQTLYFGTVKNTNVNASRFDAPPLGPEGMFDVRFTSQRYAEVIPQTIEQVAEYPVSIQATAYPVTLEWQIKETGTHTYILRTTGGSKQTLRGEGTMVINKPSASLTLLASDVNALPTEFSLGNNYPNPFNPITKFVVAVPKAANVDIVVFDILGRKVRTLMSGETAAGYHTIEWNGLTDDYSPAASGIYFIRMVSGKFSNTKKMMLMK